jgi:hypothetical protein
MLARVLEEEMLNNVFFIRVLVEEKMNDVFLVRVLVEEMINNVFLYVWLPPLLYMSLIYI